MDGKRIGQSAIHVRSREGLLEVTLERGFTQADVDAIKCIPGRKWLPERLVWVLPHTQSVLDALKQSLGSRLVLAEGLEAMRSQRTAGDFAAESRNAAGDLAAQSQHAIEDRAAASNDVDERAPGSQDATGGRAAGSQRLVVERVGGSQHAAINATDLPHGTFPH